jgi:DNA-binding response OmpR family regulator
MNSVLLIDDDIELCTLLAEYLDREGFAVSLVHDGEQGVAVALRGQHALVVLDVMMPGLGGVEVLRRIRAVSRLPVLMLTARGDDVDRIIGLELGADDYVPKPCTPRELVARIRAILRRSERSQTQQTAGALESGPLTVWPGRRQAYWHHQVLDLTSTEFNLLEVLARHAGQVVSRHELSQQALGRPLARFDRSIDVHLSSIRHKLGKHPNGESWIQTVRGQGYQLVRA